MTSVRSTGTAEAKRRRRRLTNEIKESLRELRIELSLLNYRIGDRLDLRIVDLDCLDLVSRYGPISPSALARRAGLHPATMTGILDRLERDGWVTRDRDPADRRAVLVRAGAERAADVYRLYAGMNASMDEICAGYREAELKLLADFLHQTTDAGQTATDKLTAD